MDKKIDITKFQEKEFDKNYIISEEAKTNSKFGKLVFEFPQEYNEVVAEGDPVDFVVSPQAYFRGASQIPGAEFNQSYQIFVKPFFLDRVQHRHTKDEYLIFLGASFLSSSNPLSSRRTTGQIPTSPNTFCKCSTVSSKS